jgi:L-asparaginase
MATEGVIQFPFIIYMHSKILLIYTGGTIGMMQSHSTGALKPFDFKHLKNEVPELQRLPVTLDSISFKHPIDSSNMHPTVWIELARNYRKKLR